jgi:cytosine/adenosine deaminase-related metal-dependent hydrolase
MFIRNAKLRGRDGVFDIEVAGKSFKAIAPAGERPAPSDAFDASGNILMPQFVDAHVHLGNAYTGAETKYIYPDLCVDMGKLSPREQENIIYERAKRAALAEISNGVGYIRSHVDTYDLDHVPLKALLRVKDELKDACKIQLVTFPYTGIFTQHDRPQIVETALDMGADVVGIFTDLEDTVVDGLKAVDFAMDLAERRGKLIDIHCDSFDDTNLRATEYIASETAKRGLQGRVCTSYASATGQYDLLYIQFKLIILLKKANMNFAFVIGTNMQRQCGYDVYPKRKGVPAAKELIEAGINVAFGQDSLIDPFYPTGCGNMLRVLDLALHACSLQSEQIFQCCLDLVSHNAAKALGLADYGIEEGKNASFVILDAKSDYEAVYTCSDVLCSVHEGKVVMQTKPKEVSLHC